MPVECSKSCLSQIKGSCSHKQCGGQCRDPPWGFAAPPAPGCPPRPPYSASPPGLGSVFRMQQILPVPAFSVLLGTLGVWAMLSPQDLNGVSKGEAKSIPHFT